MKPRYLLWTLPWAVIGLTACTTFLQPPADPLPQASPIDASKACANWRWIGVQRDPDADCPKIAGWEEKRLFGEKDPDAQVSDPEFEVDGPAPQVLAELNRFCVYETAKPGAVPPMSPEIVRFDRDCAALSPSASPSRLDAKTRESLAAHFLSQVGQVALVEGLQRGGDWQPDVRLAFLDTQPDGEGVPMRSGRSRHGYTLANIARSLICEPGPQGRCAATITTRLALPIVEFDPLSRERTRIDTENGGYVGTQGDLAQAIERAVDAWWNDPDREPRLVLNLSVAWDGDLFSGLDEESLVEMQAGTQAVYRALQYAAGHGVLVLAAAGNRQYGPYPYPKTGPLLPAAWEVRRVEDRCGTPREEPLLYAVGGVQSEGWPLANSRPRGLPRRVAYADHAVVSALNPSEPTAVYTGSSVATAVVSTIAAFAWTFRPSLDAYELMKVLDASGETLELEADFWFDAESAPKVHRLSLCSALQSLCPATGSPECRAQFQCNWNRQRPLLSDVLRPLPPGLLRFTESRGDSRPCLATRVLRNGGSSWPPRCPSDRLFGITSEPWLFPMPGVTPCPSCVIIPPPDKHDKRSAFIAHAADKSSMRSYTLHGLIRDDWEGGCLTDATLDVEQLEPPGSPTRRISVDLGGSYCRAGQLIEEEIQIPDDIDFNERTTATLGFVVRRAGRPSTTSAQSPVLIAR